MLRDTYDIMIKSHTERKLARPYSPLDRRQLTSKEYDDTHVKSLTGTSSAEKRQTIKTQDEKIPENKS